jgi:hypothetical protein
MVHSSIHVLEDWQYDYLVWWVVSVHGVGP